MSPCEHNQSHYSGCECHESAWIARLNAERNDLLECRLANTALQASVAALKAQLATTSKGSLSVEALQEKLGIATLALEEIVKKNPDAVNQLEAADMAVEFHIGAHKALAGIKPFSHMLPVILSEGEKLKDGQTGPR